MNEYKDPSESLTEALSKAKIPPDNHEFIRQFTNAIGIAQYRTVQNASKSYVKASRRNGGRDLYIHYGYTTGFYEQEELGGAGKARPPTSPNGTWWIEHPVNQVRPGTTRPRDTRREGDMCDCGMQLSLTGVCANCD